MRQVRFGVGIYTGESLDRTVEQARLAERLGYDSLWLLDSQQAGRELYVTMALCALETHRIKIGSGVTQPVTRSAAVTAGSFATLDELAPGRFLYGIGRGDSAVLGIGARPPSFKDFGRYLEQTLGLLRGETVDIDGTPVRLPYVDPARPPNVPLYIAADGPKALEFAGAVADRIICHPGAGESMLRRSMDLVRSGVEKAGKRLADIEVVWWVHTSIHEDWSRVKEHYRPRMVGTFRHLRAGSLEELGVSIDEQTLEQARNAYNFADHATAGAEHGSYADLFPDWAWKQVALLGNPREVYETVRRGLELYPEITHFVINPPAPGFGITVESVMEDFATQVISRLKAESGLVAA